MRRGSSTSPPAKTSSLAPLGTLVALATLAVYAMGMTRTGTAHVARHDLTTIKSAILHLGFQPGGVALRPRLEELYALLAAAEGSSGLFEVELRPEQRRLTERALLSYGENTARRPNVKAVYTRFVTEGTAS